MTTIPLVSVIMATYNESPEMIAGSVQSILNQTYQNFELLIYDDSTDLVTRNAVDELARDKRVKVFRSPERVGFVKSLNKGLSDAKGKYIARMDGDDFSLPERLEREVDFLESNPDVFIVGGQIDIMDEAGVVTSHRTYPTGGIKLFLFSCVRNPLAHPTVMFRRELVDKGYRYNETLKMSEDLDFWLRVLNDSYQIANLPETVLKYRVQSNFSEKRTSRTQVKYMANVRKSNFSKKHLVHGVLSSCAGWMFEHAPVGSLKKMYNKENAQKSL